MEKGDKTMTNKVIFHFTEEKNTILEKINFFKYKEKIETNYVCDIYGEFSYAITIVRTPKMDELFQKVIHSFSLRGIKYRVIEERETKNVMPMRRG